MDISEANYNLIKIGNCIVVQNGVEYYVIPRTTENLKSIYEYPRFNEVKTAYEYALALPSCWGLVNN